jgi:hypothetical protein
VREDRGPRKSPGNPASKTRFSFSASMSVTHQESGETVDLLELWFYRFTKMFVRALLIYLVMQWVEVSAPLRVSGIIGSVPLGAEVARLTFPIHIYCPEGASTWP